MTTLLTILVLCLCSAISIIVTYFITYGLIDKFKKHVSYVIFGGYMMFIVVNIFIWLYLYGIVYTKWENAAFGSFTPTYYPVFF